MARNNPLSLGRDLAIDLGTANTLVYVKGEGIVVSEPSVVAVDTETGNVHAVGDEAQRMIGRTPASISAVRPLRHGVIADFEVTEQMLRHFIGRVQRGRFAHPRVIMCAPSGITEVELGPVLWRRTCSFPFAGRRWDQDEWYYLARTADTREVVPEAAGLTELERRSVAGARWWTCQELNQAHETVYPTRLAELLRRLLDDGPPAGPETLDTEIV